MNPFIWCAIGAAAGWIAGGVTSARGLVSRIESVVVAMFGAVIGGEFLASFFGGAGAGGVRASAVGLALLGAIVMLLLLSLMRKVVGPMQPHKRKPTRS